MKNILLPTDFSQNSWNAMRYALEFFKNETCKFHLLNTYTPALYGVTSVVNAPGMETTSDTAAELSQEGLEATLDRLRDTYRNPDHTFTTLSAFNTLPGEVLEICESKRIDMVVMGTRGASGAKAFFLGSNTVHVIRKAIVPVLGVPDGYRFKPIHNILFPTGYESKYTPADFVCLSGILRKHKAALHIVHALEGGSLTQTQIAHKEHLKQLLKEVPTVIFKHKPDAAMPNLVYTYSNQNDIGLVAISNRKHAFLERLLLQPHVDAVGHHCKIPFLVIPHNV